MISAPPPRDEAERLAELREFDVLDTLPEEAYDDITFVAARICDAPIAMVSLVDHDRQWFKSKLGTDATETPRDVAFCAHAILEPDELMIVPDALKDARFVDNPLVTEEPGIQFYAGAPLKTERGSALGTLCVIDHRPRKLNDDKKHALMALSRQVMAQLQLRRTVAMLRSHQIELEQSNEHLKQQSMTDPLTGIGNRAAFDSKLQREIHRARRYGQPLSLVMIDIDHFKRFNDTFGHSVGDAVLDEVAKMLAGRIRSSDLASRYGGEEFAVILPNTDLSGASLVAERFRTTMDNASGEHGRVTLSLGVAALSDVISTRRDLVEHADSALYAAKRLGRNRVIEAPSIAD